MYTILSKIVCYEVNLFLLMYDSLKNDPVGELKSMQNEIVSRLNQLVELNQDYRAKQESQFLSIFLSVMDKMSSELTSANEQYQNIDKEIEKDQKCLELSKKLHFFRNQCCYLKEELEKTEQQIIQEKEKQKIILKEKQILQSDLFQKSKQVQKYKTKAKSLEKMIMRCHTTSDSLERGMKSSAQKLNELQCRKYSLSQTKNSKMTFFTAEHAEISQQRNETEFRIKAAKMAKQRKMLMNKTNYSFSSAPNKIIPVNLK